MRFAAPLLLLAAAALAEDAGDPAGTAGLLLEPGGSAPLQAPPGGNVICDDPGVVMPDYAPDGGDGFVLRALKPGSTLCGLWLAGQKPGGLYRVQVVTAVTREGADAGASDAGASDAGNADGGAGDGGAG
jgi:hypothetical protein